MKRHLAVILIFTLILSLMTGCGSQAEESKNEKANDGEGVTITFYSHASEEAAKGDYNQTAWLEAIKAYEEDTGNKVEHETNVSDWQSNLLTYAAAGECPDVMLVSCYMIETLVKAGAVLDLTDVKEMTDICDKMPEGMTRGYYYDGRLYAVPGKFQIHSTVAYNSKLWADAGYPDGLPETWDEWLACADYFDSIGVDMCVLGNDAGWVLNECWYSTLGYDYNGEEWAEHIIAKDGQASFMDESNIQALTTLDKLIDTFNVDLNTTSYKEMYSRYMNGEAATVITVNNVASELKILAEENPEIYEATKIGKMPGKDGSMTTVTGGSANGFAINANLAEADPEKYEAVIEFMSYLTGDWFNEKMASYPELGTIIMDWNTENSDELYVEYKDFIDNINFTYNYGADFSNVLVEAICTNLSSMASGAITPEQAAQAMQSAYEDL